MRAAILCCSLLVASPALADRCDKARDTLRFLEATKADVLGISAARVRIAECEEQVRREDQEKNKLPDMGAQTVEQMTARLSVLEKEIKQLRRKIRTAERTVRPTSDNQPKPKGTP